MSFAFRLVTSVACLTALASATTNTFGQDTKIMLVGDSITHGDGGVGYRYFLYRDLVDNGFTNIDFVGPHKNYYEVDPGDLANDYPLYRTDFDRDHEGHAGWQTGHHLSGNHVLGSFQTYVPDIVSIMLGTNDLGANPGNPNAEMNAINNLGTILGQLRSVNPNAKVLLTQIVPLQEGYYNNQGHRVPGYNAMLADFAANNSTVDSPVVIVDQYTGFDEVALTYDGIHPNVYGEQLVGDRYFVALQQFLSPGQPVISPPLKLTNGSFEFEPNYDGSIVVRPQDGVFAFSDTGIANGGMYNPMENTYVGAEGEMGVPQGADGSTVGYIWNEMAIPDADQRAAVTQQMSHLLQEDTEYTLEVAVGARGELNPYQSHYGGYEIDILAGDTVIATEMDEITPALGTFEDVLVSVSTTDLDSALLGKELSIRFRLTDLSARAATDFDNVRLTSVPAPAQANVPEPASAIMLALGCSLVAASRRRR